MRSTGNLIEGRDAPAKDPALCPRHSTWQGGIRQIAMIDIHDCFHAVHVSAPSACNCNFHEAVEQLNMKSACVDRNSVTQVLDGNGSDQSILVQGFSGDLLSSRENLGCLQDEKSKFD